VIALGGGAFTQPGCPELLLPRALVVHLYTPWRVMRDLLPELAADRPAARDRPMHEIQQLFLSRAPAYRRAHVRICLPRHSPEWAAARSSRSSATTAGPTETPPRILELWLARKRTSPHKGNHNSKIAEELVTP
jgi:shikimate kinase